MSCDRCGNLHKGSFILINKSSKPDKSLIPVHGIFEDMKGDKVEYKEMITGKLKVGYLEKVIECAVCDE